MTEVKTARALLEEALSVISIGVLDADTDGENLTYTDLPIDNVNWEFGGWLKGAEYDSLESYPSDFQVTEVDRPKVGVCSIGAVALASLDNFQLGTVIPVTSYASFHMQASNNSEVFKAGVYLLRAIIDLGYGERLRGSAGEGLVGAPGVQEGFTVEDLFTVYDTGTPMTKAVKAKCYGPDGLTVSVDESRAISMIANSIAYFNDDDDTTWAEVIDVFKTAIKYAIEEG